MILVSQDFDLAIRFDPSVQIYTIPHVVNDVPMGINLMYGSALLGSFDTVMQTMEIISNIMNCKSSVYVIPGFSDYDGESDFWELFDEEILDGWCNHE